MLDKALTVAAAKAKLTGLVIAAAAVGGTAVAAGSTAFVPAAGDDTVDTVTTAPTTEPTVEPTVDPTVEPTKDPAPAKRKTAPAAATPLPCPSDVANHGAYVSQVAKDKSVTGRAHGKAVSEAAHSDCGKKARDDAAEPADRDDSEAPEVEDSEAPEAPDADQDESDKSDTPKAKKPGRGHRAH